MQLRADELVSVNVLRSEVNDCKKGLSQVQAELEANTDPHFTAIMKEFVEEASQAIEDLQISLQEMQNRFNSMLAFFGQDEVETSPEEFFGTLQQFNMLFESAMRDNQKEKELEAKRTSIAIKINQNGKTKITNSKSLDIPPNKPYTFLQDISKMRKD